MSDQIHQSDLGGVVRKTDFPQSPASTLRVPPTTDDDLMQKREFLWSVHAYLGENIRFADTKATFCAGVTSALVGVLFATGCQKLFMETLFSQWNPLSYASLGAFLFLGLSLIFTIVVIRPRLWTHSRRGFIFWEAISKFEDPEIFTKAYEAQSKLEMNANLSHHVYSLAKVCHKKYFWLSAAVFSALLGGGLAVTVLLFHIESTK